MNRFPFLRRNGWLLLPLLALSFVAPACSDDDDDAPEVVETRTVRDYYVPGDARDNMGNVVLNNNPYKLMNLTTGDTAVRLNQAGATTWDIGFRALDIITNGGANVTIARPEIEPVRQGTVQYALVTNTTFEALTEVPATAAFTTDGTARPNASVGGTRPIVRTQLTTVNGQQASVVLPAPGTILIVKLASSNRYAKIEIQSYYKGYPQGTSNAPANPFTGLTPYYSFRYALTPEGSTRW